MTDLLLTTAAAALLTAGFITSSCLLAAFLISLGGSIAGSLLTHQLFYS